MNIVIPMAGRGTRMRPHTLTTPKPVLPIAGKTIVQRLVESLSNLVNEPIENIGFIIGEDFGEEIENLLRKVAGKLGATPHIVYQKSPEGIAHALLCCEQLLTGKTIIALSDTLFLINGTIETEEDGVLFVKQVEDPSAFGVVQLDGNQTISALVEKPTEFVSDLAIVGIYYFKDAGLLKQKMQYLIDNNIRTKGEFQITDAIELLRNDGLQLKTQKVEQWLDCGNKDAILETNKIILEHENHQEQNKQNAKLSNSVIVEPCFIGEDVTLDNSIIGPHVSIEAGSSVSNSIIKNTMIQSHTQLENRILKNSLLGNHVKLKGSENAISVGDYSFNEG